VLVREPAGIGDRAGGTELSAESFGKAADHIQFLGRADAAAGGDDDRCLTQVEPAGLGLLGLDVPRAQVGFGGGRRDGAHRSRGRPLDGG
jgi:hypothetical protein